MEMRAYVGRPTLTKRTGQSWKLYLGLSLIIGGGITVLAISLGPGISKDDDLLRLWLLGWLFDAAGLAIITLGIKCPACNCRFVWHDMKSASAEEWLDRGFWITECSNCGFGSRSGDDGQPTSRAKRSELDQ